MKEDDLDERTKRFALRVIRLFGSLPKRARPKCSASNFCVREHLLAPITTRRIADGANQSLSQNAATPFENSKNPLTGWNYSSMPG